MRILALAFVALSLTACTSSNDGTGGVFEHTKVIQYNGNDLHCIRYSHSLNCDWVRYHQENGF